MVYEPRFYRSWSKDRDLVSFRVVVKESDLFICANRDLSRQGQKALIKYRQQLQDFIRLHPEFLHSLTSLAYPQQECPDIVEQMLQESALVGVGPMAAVAGAIAEYVGTDLTKFSAEVIVENGGDIYINSLKRRNIGLYCGPSSTLNHRLGLQIEPEHMPLGICTSSGTFGHSLSMGQADAVVVLSCSTLLADAAATKLANHVQRVKDIGTVIEMAQKIKGIMGVVIIKDEKVGFWGDIKLIPLR